MRVVVCVRPRGFVRTNLAFCGLFDSFAGFCIHVCLFETHGSRTLPAHPSNVLLVTAQAVSAAPGSPSTSSPTKRTPSASMPSPAVCPLQPSHHYSTHHLPRCREAIKPQPKSRPSQRFAAEKGDRQVQHLPHRVFLAVQN